jgi:hypothetical protein
MTADERTHEQGLAPDELERQEAELLSDRAAMMVLRPPLDVGTPVVPIGGGDTLQPLPPDTA